MHHLNGGDQSVGHDQSSGLFELESGNSISYNRVVRQFHRSEAVEEFFVLWSQERQICLVIHHLNRCLNLCAGFHESQFNILLLSNQIAGNEHPNLPDDKSEPAYGKRHMLSPASPVLWNLT